MKPIIFVGFVLTACGGSGGGSSQTPAASATATQTATATATATSTSTQTSATTSTTTSTTAGTTKVADIVSALAQLAIGQPVSSQPAAVQALLAGQVTRATSFATGGACKKGGTTYSTIANTTVSANNDSWNAYSDGSEAIAFTIDVEGTAVYSYSYQVDTKPSVTSQLADCTKI